jgi:hypothetical protein
VDFGDICSDIPVLHQVDNIFYILTYIHFSANLEHVSQNIYLSEECCREK